MIKVVFDSNILVSATFWTGDSFTVLNQADKGVIKNFLSKEIEEEYRRVITSEEIIEKQERLRLNMQEIVERVIITSMIVIPKRKITAVKDDPDDDKIIECAVEGKVNYIITQDNHLLKLKDFEGIRIVTPKEFLDILKKQTQH